MATIDLTKFSTDDRELIEISKNAESMNLTELLVAIAKTTKRIYDNTGEKKYLNMHAFAVGAALAAEEGLTQEEITELGLIAVDMVNHDCADGTDDN